MMKLSNFLSSFRFRIVLTLVLVVASFSVASFFIYNTYLTKLIYKNAEDDLKTIVLFLQKQIVAAQNGKIIRPLLKAEGRNELILKSYILDGNGNPTNATAPGTANLDRQSITDITSSPEDISLKSHLSDKVPFSRASIRFPNAPACYNCHSPSTRTIGYVVVDFSLFKPRNTIIFTRNFSIVFTVVMVLLILGFVMVLHYRFVKKSLSEFRIVIEAINQGNLDKRIIIPRSKELAGLGHSFNEMLDNFQHARSELREYHDRELRNSKRLATIGEMSARLAHEIRNPMTGIANAVEIIIDETSNGHNKSILEEIRRQAYRVNKAVSNLLKYSQTKDINLQRDDLNEIIRSVVFFLENQSMQKKIRFMVDLDPALPQFLFDAEQIENVLLNLGLNAVQASGQDSTVTFLTSFDKPRGKMTISVTDEGPGIPEENMAGIFTPFYTTRTEGTGLGLAIVKEIVDLHQGEIGVRNNPGKGCTFSISLTVNNPVESSDLKDT
jgi:signal transduction histidine kinase